MLELELIEGFRILDLIVILAMANLITEQTIGRNLVYKIFRPDLNYLQWGGVKRFFHGLVTCMNCTTVWISFVWLIAYTIICGFNNPEIYVVVPAIGLLSSYLISKK